ncbi:MAG: hypothetical protein ACTHNS_11630 [Marmoricola sp.]
MPTTAVAAARAAAKVWVDGRAFRSTTTTTNRGDSMTSSKNGKRTTKRVAVVGGTVAALLGGGIAFAAWTSTGTGSGTATAGTSTNLRVHGSDATGLFPTGDQTVTVTVENDNPYNVQLNSIHADSFAVDSDHSGCTVANSAVTTDSGTYGTSADDISKNGGTIHRDLLVHMAASADNACKGATFTVTYTASADSTN